MDIKWTYYLIVVIYVVLVSIKVLNTLLINKFKEDKQLVAVKGFKKDFFTLIAEICIIITVIINGMTIIGGRPLNIDSIVITLLIVGMALISSHVTILLETGSLLNISGYEFKLEDIKEVKVRQKNKWDTYQINFKEDINGYENLKLYVVGHQKDDLRVALDELMVK